MIETVVWIIQDQNLQILGVYKSEYLALHYLAELRGSVLNNGGKATDITRKGSGEYGWYFTSGVLNKITATPYAVSNKV